MTNNPSSSRNKSQLLHTPLDYALTFNLNLTHNFAQDNMAQRLDLAIAPGKHLGWFRLGTSLWDIIRLLRDQAALIPVVELKYSDEHPFTADIVVRLASNGIELRFEPLSQRLKLIKVDDFSRLRLTYEGGEVSSTKALPTFLLAYKVFGPTYPGEFDGTKHLYTLSYPGLSLVFPIPEKHMLLYQSSEDLPLEFPDGTTPVASHMYIYYGADWSSATPVPIATLARNIQDTSSPSHHSGRFGEGKAELERVIAKINHGVVLQFTGATQTQKCMILLHVTTPQDLLADLGSPVSIYYKEEDKMKIHSETKESPRIQQEEDGILGEMDDIGYDRTNKSAEGSQQPNDYFYNYFHLGMDVLFDGSTHRCKKIVMHTNVPGHFDFQSYKRCPYIIQIPSSPPSSSSNQDAESARLPPIAPQAITPSPTRQQQFNNVAAGESTNNGKVNKKKSRASGNASVVASSAEAMEPIPSSYSSGESSRGSPDLLGSSPVPSSGDAVVQDLAGLHIHQQHQQQQQQQQQLGASSTGGMMTAIALEKGITPEMKIPTIMALLDPASTISSAAGTPNKPAVILNRGSSTQNPFGPTTLNGTDGVVFEATRNGHVVTVILY
ncbi:hypothetical protein BGX23_007379 [Mortierella sp. AD031]|nr:hypothetical protein BGX23_007379 [Mortierella sp. AD031]KAG0212423.1 hypothetical protein BGX33_003642 [Mortierella sp. NVP41]